MIHTDILRMNASCGHTMPQYGLSPTEWNSLHIDADYEVPLDHAPPLLMHANMLKESAFTWLRDLLGPTGWAWIKTISGNGWNYRKGNTFNQIKQAQPDHVRSLSNSTFLIERLRHGVFPCRGAGTDYYTAGDQSGGDTDRVNGITDGEGVVMTDFAQAWGGLLRDFEDLFYSTRSSN